MDDFDRSLQAAKAGDDQAFVALFRAFNPALLRYLQVVAHGTAEDLASETWLDAVRSLPRFEGDESGFRGWLFTIARRRHLDQRRRERRRPVSAGDDALRSLPSDAGGDDPAIAVDDEAATALALELIATLPPDQAEVVALRAIGGLEIAEVAEITGKTPGAVRVLSHRGLHRLATVMGSDVPPIEV